MLLAVKEKKKYPTLVKILILAIALLIVSCLVLLNLYLIERSRNPKTTSAEKSVTSRTPEQEKYYGGSCWTTDCLHAASGKTERNLIGDKLQIRMF